MNKMSALPRVPTTSASEFYHNVLDGDSHAVPAVLRESSPFEGDVFDISVERYTSKAYHDREIEHLWKRVWQMACREEELPNVGDTYLYELAHLKFIIVRTGNGSLKAFPNSCLHRGRQLVDCDGRYGKLKCPFHGFTWDLDGTLASVPGAWDFPQITDPEDWHLPEIRVDTWGGFIFINPDPAAGPLMEFLGDIDRHFNRYPLQDRYISGHARKVMPANWKLVQEAFMETLHVHATHPQLLGISANTDNPVDTYGNYARAISISFIPSMWLQWDPSNQDMMDVAMDVRLDGTSAIAADPERSARRQMADLARAGLARMLGQRAEDYADTEMVDSFFFNVFPNLHPWASFSRICFQFRPCEADPDHSIMDVYLLTPFTGERPKPAKVHLLGANEDWTAAPEIGSYLARIINQDLFNMAPGQAGLKTSTRGTITFSAYQESKIRHFHKLLGEWVGQ